jgi:CpeT/CpcT family (DUF1001)
MRKAFVYVLTLGALTACATPHANPRAPQNLLLGTWDNSAQFASAPETLKRAPVAGGAYEWIDTQHANFFAVDAPLIAGKDAKAIYLVWRSGGPTGPISRQRLWVFRTLPSGQIVMDFYAFKAPVPFENATGPNDAFKALMPDDLTAYGPQCALPVVATATGWQAAIPNTCSITARSGRAMVLSATIVASKDRLIYTEQGTLSSGALAFKVPGGPAYEFVRRTR